MEQIQISKFKATCFAVLERVARTREPILITRRGQPVARIIPPAPSPASRWLGSMKGSVEIHGDVIAPVSEPSE